MLQFCDWMGEGEVVFCNFTNNHSLCTRIKNKVETPENRRWCLFAFLCCLGYLSCLCIPLICFVSGFIYFHLFILFLSLDLFTLYFSLLLLLFYLFLFLFFIMEHVKYIIIIIIILYYYLLLFIIVGAKKIRIKRDQI